MGRTFNMIGGGGGGTDSGAYVGFTPPAAQLGKNGDYYFELAEYHSHNLFLNKTASTGTAGFEFTVSSNMYLYGVAGLARTTYSGEIKFGTIDGTILKTVNVDLVANTWVPVLFDEPLLLTPGVNYIVMLFGHVGTLGYTSADFFVDPDINYVQARYGGFPGTTESGNIYATDILIGRKDPPFSINKSYYKSSGAWSEY